MKRLANNTYSEQVQAIRVAIAIGIDAELDDPAMVGRVPDLTPEQIDWLASWLASERIGRIS